MIEPASICDERLQSDRGTGAGEIRNLRCSPVDPFLKSVEPNYFAMMKAAIAEAARLFEEDGVVPPSFLHELEIAAQILRNEATAFEGRTAACLGMAEWLDATLRKMTSLTRSAAAEE